MTCILKAPFNSFSYELVGDGSATTFFQISSGGSVSLRQSVATDSSNMFQVLGISFQHLYHIRNKLCLNFSRKKIIWFWNTDRKHCTCKLKLIDEKHLVYLIFIFLIYFWQLRVRVKDGGTPQKQDEEHLTVYVEKNLANPVMVAQAYTRQILEIQTVSETLVTVQATDADAFVSHYLWMIISVHNCKLHLSSNYLKSGLEEMY